MQKVVLRIDRLFGGRCKRQASAPSPLPISLTPERPSLGSPSLWTACVSRVLVGCAGGYDGVCLKSRTVCEQAARKHKEALRPR
jgi:hypothetical protein